MRLHQKLKKLSVILSAVFLLFSATSISTYAVTARAVTAATTNTVKQGNTANCYVYIDSTKNLASLDVTVHFDPAKVKVISVYNHVGCTLYDSVINTDNIQFSYIFDGTGTSSKTQLFYFQYQVLSNAEAGNTSFDITIGEACDTSLNNVAVFGSRCSFTISKTVTNKSCSVYGSSSVSTAIAQEFTLNYRFSTYEIASGTAVITYDSQLFEVVDVTNGPFLTGKVVDINTDLNGEIYVSFVGTEYYSNVNLISVTFKTINNVAETSKITFETAELIDKELNSILCNGYTTNVSVAYDENYAGDAPAMRVDGVFSYADMQITLQVLLEANSHLGAGDFVLTFDPELVSFNSCTKGFTPDFFNVDERNVANGRLKFHIISLSDIMTEESVLTIVFDVKHPYSGKDVAFTLDGAELTNSLTERILLNFVDASVLLEYQVVFCDADGTVLESGLYHYGDTIHVPEAPTKENDVCGKYTFSGWNKEITPCTADVIYTPTYTVEYTNYTVTFKNWDGTVISTKTYHWGDVVTAPANPKRPHEEDYAYIFAGWDKIIIPCSGDTSYTALYNKTAVAITSIAVTTKPTKLTYIEGDTFNQSGMIVTAYYNNDTSKVVTGYTISGYTSTVGIKTITVTYEGKTTTFAVTVNSKVPSTITSPYYTISNGTISRISTDTTVSALIGKLNEQEYVKVYNGNQEVSGNTLVGTGMVVKIMDGNTVKASYTIVVTGDTNGDGKITITDMLAAKSHVLKKSTLIGAAAEAADTSGDNAISITDFIQMKAHILGKSKVEPRSTTVALMSVTTTGVTTQSTLKTTEATVVTANYTVTYAQIPNKKTVLI